MSGHVQLAQSSALHQGAENLLTKALDALAKDQPERAQALVRRALRIPFDEYEESSPAWWQAYFMVFMAITDEAEDGPGDQAWLDAALQVEEQATGHGRDAVRLCLEVMDHDYELNAGDSRLIRSRIGKPRQLRDWQDLLPEDDDAAVTAILQVLAAYNAYDDALDAACDS